MKILLGMLVAFKAAAVTSIVLSLVLVELYTLAVLIQVKDALLPYNLTIDAAAPPDTIPEINDVR